jgi:hypothetical protein
MEGESDNPDESKKCSGFHERVKVASVTNDFGSIRRAQHSRLRRAKKESEETIHINNSSPTHSKLEERKVKNRKSAELSRKRKAEYVKSIEKRAKSLSVENQALLLKTNHLEAEITLLKAQLYEPSPNTDLIFERNLCFLHSAIFLHLFNSIFSQQLEIMCPVLLNNDSDPQQLNMLHPCPHKWNAVLSTSCLMSHYLMSITISLLQRVRVTSFHSGKTE